MGQQLIFLISPTGFQELEKFLKLNAFLIIAFCRPTALSDQVRRLVFDVFALRFCPIELLLAQPGFLSFPGVVRADVWLGALRDGVASELVDPETRACSCPDEPCDPCSDADSSYACLRSVVLSACVIYDDKLVRQRWIS